METRRWLLVAAVFSVVRAVNADGVPVQDNARIFSESAVRDAVADLRRLQDLYQVHVLIETFSEPSASARDSLRGAPSAVQDRIFSEWQRERMTANWFRGLHILICRSPARIQIGMNDDRLRKTFTASDRRQIRDDLAAGFRSRLYDPSLHAAIARLRTRILDTVETKAMPERSATIPAPVSSSQEVRPASRWAGWIVFAICLAFVSWVVGSVLLRSDSLAARSSKVQLESGGGSVLPAVATGMVGAAAGALLIHSLIGTDDGQTLEMVRSESFTSEGTALDVGFESSGFDGVGGMDSTTPNGGLTSQPGEAFSL